MAVYINRAMEGEFLRISGQFPVTVLTGPRQTGKSTFLTHLFPRHNYITFDDSSLRLAANRDPALFVETLRCPAVLDEVQYAPEILPYIKMHVDRDRVNGRFILTGSQVFNLTAGISESLAGRACLFELLPFSFGEMAASRPPPRSPLDCYHQILKGFYPVPNTGDTDTKAFYGAYLSLYIERDVRQIKNIGDITAFENFLQILAGRAGNLLNMADLARDCGIAQATAKNWLSILENSRIVYLLRPYSRNISKRLVKSPKLYFTDTGLLAYLLRYGDVETVMAGPAGGMLFENMVIMEFLKNKTNKLMDGDLYFYRDSNGVEIDLAVDRGGKFDLYEIKAVKTPRPPMAAALSRTRTAFDTGRGEPKAALLSFYENPLPLAPGVTALPWWEGLRP